MKAMKMTDLVIDEMSGVDHPAHAHEGWLVVKARDVESVDRVTRVIADERGRLMRKAMYGATMDEEEKEAIRSADEARIAELEKRIAAHEEQHMGKQEDEVPPFIQERMREREAEKMRRQKMRRQKMMDEKEEAEKAEALYALTESDEDEDEEDANELMKSASPAVRTLLRRYAKSRDDARTELRKERERQEDAEAVRKAAVDFKHLAVDPSVLGPALRRLSAIDTDLAVVVKSALRTANAQNESGAMFTELGASGAPAAGNAYGRLTNMAKAAVASGSAATLEQAISKIAVDNPHLYEDYLRERV